MFDAEIVSATRLRVYKNTWVLRLKLDLTSQKHGARTNLHVDSNSAKRVRGNRVGDLWCGW